MQRVEAYRVEIPIVAIDEYSRELDKADKMIDGLEKKAQKSAKAQDDFSKSSRNAAKSQSEVSKSTKEAAKGVQEVGKSAEQAEKQVGRVTKTFRSFGSKVKSLERAKATVELAVKDNATRVMDRVRGTWESFKRNPVTRLTVSAVDRAMRILRGIKNTVLSIPTMITIGLSYVGIKNLSEATVGAAMNWEQYEVSMEHWLDGNTKKAKELTKWMGEFADITPFSSPELFPALTRAVAISDKDLTKSKRLLAIASDMAALTPDRSVEDAMQSIANSKMGNTVMLQGFGLDISKKQMDAMGGWDKLLDKLEKDFKGGAEKLSKTAAGVLATLKGYRGSFMRAIGTGFLEPMKPRLDAINKWLGNNQETWGRWKDSAKDVGKVFSEMSFSNLEKGFNYLNNLFFPENDGKEIKGPKYTGLLEGMSNPYTDQLKNMLGESTFEPQELTIKAKLKILYEDASSVVSAWWDETGSGVAVEIGKSIGSGILEGIKIGLQAGGDLLSSSYKELFTNLKNGEDAGGSAAMAAATTLGAGYLAKKLIYNPVRGAVNTGKDVRRWANTTSEKRQATRGTRQEKWNQSNDKRIQRGLSRGDRAREKREAKNDARANGKGSFNNKKWTGPAPQSAPYPKWLQKQIEKNSAPKFMSGGGASKNILKGVSGKIPGLSLLFGAKDATKGWKEAGSIMGKASDEVTLLDKASASAAQILEGFSFGLIKAEKTVDFFSGGKTAEQRYQLENGITPTRTVGTESQNGLSFDYSAINQSAQELASTLSAMNEKAQGSLQNITSLTMVTGEAAGWITGAFYPLSEGTLAHNANALSITLGESTVAIASSFMPLTSTGAALNQNTSALSLVLGESSGHVVGAFYPLSGTGAAMNQNASALSMTLGMASGWVASINGIQTYAQSVKTALSNLTSRINSVPAPTISGPSVSTRRPGGVQAYARGGIATSPHLGLVAEAGVPEAMIPWDGSSRSKALWQQTGEALGMFGSGASGVGGNNGGPAMVAASGGGETINIGDINIAEGNNLSAEEILNMIMPALYEKIKAAISKRR